jgi:putative hydrolase of the HAD superfamily
MQDITSVVPVRAICFDLFNTLVNVGRVPESVGAFTADILGMDHETWRQACFGEHHDICRPTDPLENMRCMAHAIDAEIPEAVLLKAVTHRQQRFDHALRYVEEGLVDDLAALREAGIRLALVSNASTAEVRAWPESPLAPLFDSVLFSCECGYKKPDAKIYQLALEQLAVNSSECLFVGDGGSNEHQGAHFVGMHPVLMTRHSDRERERKLLKRLDGVLHTRVESVNDLLKLMETG